MRDPTVDAALKKYGKKRRQCTQDEDEAWHDDSKPIHVVKGHIADIVDQAEAALLEVADAVPIMVRAGMLVQPIVDQLPASHQRMTDVTLLKPLTNSNIIYLLNKHAADFKQYDRRSKKWLVIDPPGNVATQLLQKGHWRFPKVAGVITAPTLRPDGSILDRPGYDPATALWYAPDGALTMPPCKNDPSSEDGTAALALFDDLFSGFPFVTDVDRSVAASSLLTCVLRGAFDLAPMHLFRAHDVGSGKSLLADLLSTVARGQPCPVITFAKSVKEMEKRLDWGGHVHTWNAPWSPSWSTPRSTREDDPDDIRAYACVVLAGPISEELLSNSGTGRAAADNIEELFRACFILQRAAEASGRDLVLLWQDTLIEAALRVEHFAPEILDLAGVLSRRKSIRVFDPGVKRILRRVDAKANQFFAPLSPHIKNIIADINAMLSA